MSTIVPYWSNASTLISRFSVSGRSIDCSLLAGAGVSTDHVDG
jgi:hypothetical protein